MCPDIPAGPAPGAKAVDAGTYILNGYGFGLNGHGIGGMAGLNTAAITAKLKLKEG
jgi:hypothetical protein